MQIKSFSGYYLNAKNDKNQEIPIMRDFLNSIFILPFRDKWDAEFGANNTPVTILSDKWIPNIRGDYYYGKFVEVRYIDKLELINLDGEEDTVTFKQEQGEKSEFHFIFCPEKQVALVELKGRGIESKIQKFFSRHWEKFNKNKEHQPLLINCQAIAIAENAKNYLSDKTISNMRMAIDCSKISRDSSLFSLIKQLVNTDDLEQLVVDINFSTVKRGDNLSKLSMSTLVDLMEKIQYEHALKSASCNEIIDHKKSNKITKLLGIQHRKDISVSDEIDLPEQLIRQLDDLIDQIDED